MVLPVRFWRDLSADEKTKIFRRSEQDISQVLPAVQAILDDVRARGDEAVAEYTNRFDKTSLGPDQLRVTEAEIDAAEALLTPEVKDALRFSIENVEKVHRTQKPEGMTWVEVRPGILAGERPLAIDSVGLYVPGGRGKFPSMVYMQAVPARIAGVKRIVLVTPPQADGTVDPACLYAARLCGVHEIYKTGGAQALAALAYGTATIAPVVKVNGPGSMYVAAAKRLLAGRIDVGLPAGPSESAVLADHTAKPWKVALDLMVEAEHGSDSCALLVTTSEDLAKQTAQYIGALAERLPEPRRTFLKDVFAGYGAILVVDTLEEGAAVVNDFAPEHLSIQTEEPFATLSLITNASEILLGENLPFSGANYACGPNAILPTGGKAKTWGPTSVRDFLKYSSVIYATGQGYDALKGPVTTLADYEGFPSHADAFRKRGDV
jgi:histidinol dehydrogenase